MADLGEGARDDVSVDAAEARRLDLLARLGAKVAEADDERNWISLADLSDEEVISVLRGPRHDPSEHVTTHGAPPSSDEDVPSDEDLAREDRRVALVARLRAKAAAADRGETVRLTGLSDRELKEELFGRGGDVPEPSSGDRR